MNAFERSWNVTKLTFGVINKDRELLWFAFLSFIFSVIFTIAMIFPTIVPAFLDESFSRDSLEAYQYVILFVTYFGLAFIATFFNVCVVYTTKVRFEGGNATFSESIRFAFSRISVIVQWSLVSASVGLLLRILHNLASRLGKVGELVANIVIGLLGMAWSILTIFVVPVLVYENVGPIDAIKRSAEAIKRTWGESLIKAIGMGLVQVLAFIVLILIGVGIVIALSKAFDIIGLLVGVCIMGALLLLAGLVFSVANTVFNTALYLYANQNKVAAGYDEEMVRGAFKQK